MKSKSDKTGIILKLNGSKLWKLFCVALIFGLFTGCAKDNPPNTNSGLIEISPVILQGRITGNSFDTGDRIGFFATASPGLPSGDNYAANIPYIYNGSSWTSDNGNPLLWPGNEDIDLYAYYPFDPGLSSADPRAYTFSINPDQTTLEKYLNNDFLWARTTGASPGTPVPLRFFHLMSRIQINIRSAFNAGSNWPSGADINIVGLSDRMVIDLYDGSITSGTSVMSGSLTGTGYPVTQKARVLNAIIAGQHEPLPRELSDIRPLTLDIPSAGYDISLVAIIMPQPVRVRVPLLRVSLDGTDYTFIPGEDFIFGSGENFIFNLTLTDQPPGLVLDLDQIDWDQSRVWNVYNGSEIVAQVCREYLQGSSAPDVQAVVVYLAGSSGVDFSSGFAARVYQSGKNAGGDYDINTQNIHGGSVNFSASTLYTQGVLAPVRKVTVVPGTGISGSYNAAPVNLTVKAVTVSDYDGNKYPLVKINRWYWTASNFISLHYMNGNSFTAWPYNRDPANTPVYGLLYTGIIAYDPQPLLPSPWRMPLETDYDAMIAYLQPSAGSKIKANVLWNDLSTSNDVTGFRMLPGGYSNGQTSFFQLGTSGYLWTDTYDGFLGTCYVLNSQSNTVNKNFMSHNLSMSLRFLLTDSSVLTSIPAE